MNKRPLSDRDAPQIPYAADKRPEPAEKRNPPFPTPSPANWAETRQHWRGLPWYERAGEILGAACVIALPFVLLFIAAACGIH